MFIVKGRLLGTVLSLLIAALGAVVLSHSPTADESPLGCTPPAAAAQAASLPPDMLLAAR